ncbi:MAG TPA: hypothetical protein VIS72_17965 [Anaerolineales bacterium]
MYTIQKLKPDRNFFYPILLPFAYLLVASLIGAIWGAEMFFNALTVLFWCYALYSLLTYVRTLNAGFLVPMFFQISVGFLTLSMPITMHNPANKGWTAFLIFAELFFMIWVIMLAVNRKIKWRGREILELAAAPVEQIGNGYTPRPLPSGRTEFTQRQIEEFADFARRNLIAVTYFGKDKIVFVPVVMGRETGFILGLKSDYTDETWVAFDNGGNVSVNISHRDYLEYKESLAFDQLCASLGDLFVDFIEMYNRGEGVRVIDRLNAVGVSIFS